MNVLAIWILLLNFILGLSARRLFMFDSDRPLRLPPQEALQSFLQSSVSQQAGQAFPRADQASQVRKQIFSRKFW